MSVPTGVTTIPPGVPFVDALARGLLAETEGDPLALARMTVLLPQRRTARALHEAFLRLAEGRALLLPRMMPLGDVDAEELLMSGADTLSASGLDADLPPVMPEHRRQLLLTTLVRRWGEKDPDQAAPTVDHAARLAAELARLMDQVENEGLDFDGLAGLVPERHAQHWQTTLEFLKIVTEHWPQIEVTQGAVGPAARRRRLLEAQAETWRTRPPAGPVIAAGSTGSMPATAALLKVVAALPQGCVVLPGLDRDAGEAAWDAVRRDATHPQHSMARLLDKLGTDRGAVGDWPYTAGVPVAPTRAALFNLALRPAEATTDWREATAEPGLDQRVELALRDVRRLDCPDPVSEAGTIALLLREALETPDRTAALVTPDRNLARRVASELARWGLAVDDSAGVPLDNTEPGTFLRLTATMLAEGLAPLPLLAALKHPLAAGGEDPASFRRKVRRLERAVLRGPRPRGGFRGLREALAATKDAADLLPWLDGVYALATEAEAALAAESVDLATAVDAHMRFAEALAASDSLPGPARIWHGDAGEALADFASDLIESADVGPAVAAGRYPGLLDSLMAGRVVRPRYGGHPRLAIWGSIEARLQRADLMILGGLNEGTWPAETDPGPWLSRPMRADFGLPPVEQRIGLMAHDFVQAACAPEVVITRAERAEGTPTVPSRWLLRLDAVLGALGMPGHTVGDPAPVAWARALDTPETTVRSAPPAPAPPVVARPRSLSVTRIETWRRNPYGLYAERILGLRALDPIDQDPGAAERGTLIHRALEAFVRAYPDALPEDPAGELKRLGHEVFDALDVRPGVRAFWWPRFERVADYVADLERERRAGGDLHVLAELRGGMSLDAPGGRFTVTAKADRIERRADGGIVIVDYKTGAPPSETAVLRGDSPQLALEAAIAADGGFGDLGPAAVVELAYWQLTGGPTPGKTRALKKASPGDLAAQAVTGLKDLVRRFDDPATPYHAYPDPDRAPAYDDYAHLARIEEWSAGGEDSEG